MHILGAPRLGGCGQEALILSGACSLGAPWSRYQHSGGVKAEAAWVYESQGLPGGLAFQRPWGEAQPQRDLKILRLPRP